MSEENIEKRLQNASSQKDELESFPVCPKCGAELDAVTTVTFKCSNCDTKLSELFGEEQGKILERIRFIEEEKRKGRVKARLEEDLTNYPELREPYGTIVETLCT